MKRLEISKLMDEYRDDEFFPEEWNAADVAVVKDKVLAKAALAGTRRKPSLKTVLLAAALAVGCLLSIAAGLPMKVYQLISVSGDSMIIQTDETGKNYLYYGWENTSIPIVLEDGRLWLVLRDEERIDVTDLIDEDTPYIVEGQDPETGLKNYLAVGGTPEDYGYVLIVEMPLGGHTSNAWNTYSICCDVGGELIEYNDWAAFAPHTDDGPMPSESIVFVNKPWYDHAIAQLSLWS